MSLSLCTLLLVTAPALPAASTQASGGETAPIDIQALIGAKDWPELVARDRRLSFTSGSAREARKALAQLKLPLLLAWAYFAVGSGGELSDRPLLEDAAGKGDTLARQGAIFGLGELGAAAVPFLAELVRKGDPTLAPCAVGALARTRTAEGDRVLRELESGLGPFAEVARGALALREGSAAGSLGGIHELFLNLRWGAARRYGYVDGMRWQVHLESVLARDEAFLDRVILGASRHLRAEPLRDHLLEIALAGGPPERLRGVVAGMGEAFGELVQSGLWEPSGEAEWAAVLEEIESRGVTEADVPLLVLAAEKSEARRKAGRLLVGAGIAEGFDLIKDDLSAAEPEVRLATAEALGGLKDPARVADLSRLRRDEDPRVRAAALIALVRHKDQPSIDTLADLLAGGASDGRSHAIQMLCRASADQSLHRYLDEVLLLSDLDKDQRLAAEVALSLHGRVQPKAALREALEDPSLGTALAEHLVRALSQNPEQADLVRMRAMFPVENAPELNVALATGLIAARDPGATNLLRQAIWRGPWNRSVLAAGLLVRMGGIQALHNELASPPARVGEEDMRRVGWALGEWGGLAEVEVLARRRRSGDAALQGAFLGALATRTH